MTTKLKKAAKTVQDLIYKYGLNCEVHEFESGTRTAIDAANSIGCAVGQISKSLIFRSSSNNPILILASGPNRVDEKLMSLHINESIEKADADFTRKITGFAIGGIPPIGHLTQIKSIFIDKDLLQYDDVWAAAGTPNTVFNIKIKDLIKMTEGEIVTITR